MFWGLIMEPKRRYTQKVKQPFHISMAALDIFSADDEPTQLMLYFEERNYLLCTLQKGQTVQCSLDLNFEAGDEIAFATNGHSNVHLSGYLQEELDDLMGEQEVEEEEEDEESEVKIETKNKKRKVGKNESQPPQKKSKLAKLLDKTYDSEDDESFALPDDLEEEEGDSSEGDDDEEVEEEEGDQEDESGEEEEDSNEEEVSSLSEDDEEEEIKPKQNGVASKKKNKEARKKALQNEQKQQSPKIMNKTPKGEKMEKTPSKQEKLDIAQKGNKTPKGEKTPKSNKTPNQKEAKTPASPNQQNATPQKRTLEGGIIVQDLKLGEGQAVKSGKMIQVYYEGRLKQNNKVFDQNTKGSGFKFRLGRQEVIKGWDVGVVGMKVGGKRRIICPPNMAYGNKGSPPVIPPSSTLVFEVELKSIC